MASRRYLVLGDGAAGMTAIEALRRADAAGEITVVSDDPHPAYFRASLARYVLGELGDDRLRAVTSTFFEDLGARRVLARATRVDAKRREVALADGARVAYDALLVATGARAREAPFDGGTLGGVRVLRTLHDARSLVELVKAGVERAVVVGGGPLALEWAYALRERGLVVTLVARGDRVMPDVLDAPSSELLVARLRGAGIEVHMGEEVASAWAGKDGRVGSVVTRRGRVIEAQLVGVAVGVVCNTELLAGSGVALGPHGGVAVDEGMRASVAHVFAAGDVAERGGRLLQRWEPARAAARIAALNMTGASEVFAPGVPYIATRLGDLDLAAVGDVDVRDGDTEIVAASPSSPAVARRALVLRGGRLVRAILLGDRAAHARDRGRLYKRLIDEGVDVSAIGERLLDPAFDLRAFLDARAVVAPATGDPKDVRPADVRATQRTSKRSPLIALSVSVSAPSASASASTGVVPTMERAPLRLPEPPVASAVPVGTSSVARTRARERPAATVADVVPSSVPRDSAALAQPVVSDRLQLEVRRGARVGLRFAIASAATIGRDPATDVWIDDPSVSREHARITREDRAGGRWSVTDLQAARGTTRNGVRLDPGIAIPLDEGDTLGLGDVVLVVRALDELPRVRSLDELPQVRSLDELPQVRSLR